MPNTRRIALFGGTFDPTHLGHVALADLARQALALDEVRFLPCRFSPHKRDVMPSSASDRLEMLRLAIDGLPWAVVDDFEICHEGPSFSYQTAEAMAGRFPGVRLFWIMGCDQWEALSRWEQPQRLAACVEFIVFARGGHPMSREGYVLHVVKGEHPASATSIREAVGRRESSHPWLAPPVADWIERHQLYRNEGATT
jgi:nicotinate-nucleotide adenylyltransferase